MAGSLAHGRCLVSICCLALAQHLSCQDPNLQSEWGSPVGQCHPFTAASTQPGLAEGRWAVVGLCHERAGSLSTPTMLVWRQRVAWGCLGTQGQDVRSEVRMPIT